MGARAKRGLIAVGAACAVACGASWTLACGQSSASGAGKYAHDVSDAVPRVERAVGLRFKRPPRVESRTRAEVRAFLEKEFTESHAVRDLDGTESAYKLFGLLPDTLHLRAELENLYTEQIAGFYDPKTKVLYIVDGAPAPEVEVVVAHELVHALQDQYINLDSLESLEGDDDRAMAAQAVIEGQAVFDQLVGMVGNRNFMSMIPGGWDAVRQQVRENKTAMPELANAPMVLQESMIFPYLSGIEFVHAFDEHEPGAQPFADMPTSTEQILHPEQAYFAHRDPPVRVRLPAPPGGAARVRYDNDMGEFTTRLFFYQHLDDQAAAIRGASGWGGDRYEVVTTPRGPALAWVTVWDSPISAGQFRDLLKQTVARRYGAHPSRAVTISAVEIGGYPGVVYEDEPAGATERLVDVAQVRTEVEKK